MKKVLSPNKIIVFCCMIGVLIGIPILNTFSVQQVSADEIEAIQEQIETQNAQLENVRNDLENSKKHLENLSINRGSLYGQLTSVRSNLAAIETQMGENVADIEALNSSIEETSGIISDHVEQKNQKIKSLYFDLKLPFIEKVLEVQSINYLSKIWKYKEAGIQADRATLVTLNSQLAQLNDNLEEGRKLQEELVAINVEIEVQITDINTQIAGLDTQIFVEGQRQVDISSQIGEIESLLGDLTAKQEALIRARIEAANKELRLSDGEPLSASIPQAPFTGGFAVASYGGPHRVGMNQYGALGRASAGQSAAEILNAYFANIAIDKSYGSDYTITVNGNNGSPYNQDFNNVKYNIEEYLKHLYEMPAYWPSEALKAQAIAARTYALQKTQNGALSICPNQNCQVVKLERNTQSWQDAVEATAGWVIKNAGDLITPWYCSTSGGYTKTSEEVWGGYTAWTQAIKDYGPNGAYDGPAYGDSSWYHMAWGGVSDSWTCENCLPPCYWRGDCQPWLTNEQTQDLFNVMLLREIAGNVYDGHLSPVNWGDPDTWNEQQVIDKLIELGGTPVGHITSIITYENSNTGDTTTVVVKSGAYLAREFGAIDFKSIFYMRSPGTLIIRSSRFDFVLS